LIGGEMLEASEKYEELSCNQPEKSF